MLAAVKAWPVEPGAPDTCGAPAILDGGCARRHVAWAGRDEETVPQSNQETANRQQRDRRLAMTSPLPAGASTASEPTALSTQKRTSDVLPKPDNLKSY